MTKKTKNILSIFTAVIVVIIIALSVFIKIYITPERVKAFLIPAAEKALNRKVYIGEIKISLFKGIEAKDFSIKEEDGKSDFLKCKAFVLKYKFLPLLSKQVIIDELKLVSPEIRIERNLEGNFNFEGIVNKPEDVTDEQQTFEPKGLPVSLLISKVVIKDARFSLLDLKKELPDVKGSFHLDLSMKSPDREQIFSQGEIDLKLDDVVINKPSVRHITNITTWLKYTVNLKLDSFDIRIDKADVKFQEIPASVTGTVVNIKTSPEIDLAVSIPKVKTADVQKSLAAFVDLKELGLSGSLAADLKVRGMPKDIDSLKADGNVMLENVGVAYKNIHPFLDGNVRFNEQSITIDLKGTIGKNRADLKGSISNYLKNQKIKLDLYSKNLTLDEIIPTGTPKDTASPQKEKTDDDKPSTETKPLNLKLIADGEIKIDSARYKGLHMSNFFAKYHLKNNKLKIPKMTAYAGKGKFTLDTLIDLSKPGYTYALSCNLDSLHADELVNSFFPKAKDTIFGILSFNLMLNGAGTLPANVKKNLVGDGNFSIKNGKITNSKIPDKLALFLGIPELRTIKLKKAHGTIIIRNSIARLESIFSSDDISMDPSGNIGLDETLDLAFDLKLSPRLTDKVTLKSNLSSFIKDEKGWGNVPLKVSGAFVDPSYSVDVAKAGKRVIEKKGKRLLENLFKKEDDKKSEKDIKKEDKKPVQDLFKGLFK
jgi:AsmA protein